MLEIAAPNQHSRKNQIFIAEAIQWETGKTAKAAAYGVGNKSGGFIWLNFCPWCGADIRAFPSKKNKKKRRPIE